VKSVSQLNTVFGSGAAPLVQTELHTKNMQLQIEEECGNSHL
jgi:hypothetical protein